MMSLILPKNKQITFRIVHILSVFCSFFGRIRDFFICFQDLLTLVSVKSTVNISSIFVAFLENTNFITVSKAQVNQGTFVGKRNQTGGVGYFHLFPNYQIFYLVDLAGPFISPKLLRRLKTFYVLHNSKVVKKAVANRYFIWAVGTSENRGEGSNNKGQLKSEVFKSLKKGTIILKNFCCSL